MKKIAMLLIALMVVSLGLLSGCNEVEKCTDSVQLSIISFEVDPSIIKKGETANLSWFVTGATTQRIDNGIGNVGVTGTRIIMPSESTTYTLTIVNATTTLTATTAIIVTEPTEPPEPTTSIAMNIFDRDTSAYTVIWMVSQVEGETVAYDEYDWTLLDTSGVNVSGATFSFNDNNNDNYVNSGDNFAINTTSSASYVLTLSDRGTGSLLFKSASTKY